MLSEQALYFSRYGHEDPLSSVSGSLYLWLPLWLPLWLSRCGSRLRSTGVAQMGQREAPGLGVMKERVQLLCVAFEKYVEAQVSPLAHSIAPPLAHSMAPL